MSGLDFLQEKTSNWHRLSDLWGSRGLPDNARRTSSPAREVHLVASQVDIGVGEHGADILEELSHEVVRGVQDGVHRSEGAGGFGARVTRCEQIFLAWQEDVE